MSLKIGRVLYILLAMLRNQRRLISVIIATKSAYWSWGYKTCFILNLAEHEKMLISIKISRNLAFSGSDEARMLFFLLVNVKMPRIVGISTFMSRKNFMLS